MRIVVDAMGGDYAPEAPVEGALLYLEENGNRDELILVGDQAQIQEQLTRHQAENRPGIHIVHASEVIGMYDQPAQAVRQKKDSSMVKGTRMLKEGEAEAFVSAGSTGAQMASSLLTLGRVKGVNRPALGAFIPYEDGVILLIDVGANADCKPINMLQFGMMGSLFMQKICDITQPRIGLLNIGAEAGKGNELVATSYDLLKSELGHHFIGNVEGRYVFNGEADVLVCDGFTGNVLLKFAEGVIGTFEKQLKKNIKGNLLTMMGGMLMRPALRQLRQAFDYQEYGGVPLLGVDGISIICHGSSSPRALKNAIRVARNMSDKNVNQHIEAMFGAEGELWGEKQSLPV